jgi:TolB protein
MTGCRAAAAWIIALNACASAVSAQDTPSAGPTLGPPRQLTAIINSYPSPSPDGDRVVFQSNRTGRFELYVMNRDGTGLRQLTSSPGHNVTPKWSPDGTLIVFAAEPQPDNSEIYIMNADGSGQRLLNPAWGDDSHPRFSPDGARVIFNSSRNTPDRSVEWGKQWHDIYSVKVDGSDLRQHTHCHSVCTYPGFSPDGQWIVYRKVVDVPGFEWDLTSSSRNSEVFIARVDGRDERNVSNSAAFDGWPVFTSDGRGVIFSSNRAGRPNVGQLYFVALDGSAPPSALTSGARSVAQPAISRDGKWLFGYANDESADWEYGDIVAWPLQRQ